MFGLFDNWKQKLLKKIEGNNHNILDCYYLAKTSKILIEKLIEELSVDEFTEQHKKILAFYLGSIESNVNRLFDLPEDDQVQTIKLILLIASYVDLKDNIIETEKELDSRTNYFVSALKPDEYRPYRHYGFTYTEAISDGDSSLADGEWNKFLLVLEIDN